MISGRSCDTEDWSNDAENSALPLLEKNYILKYNNLNEYLTVLLFLMYFFYQ